MARVIVVTGTDTGVGKTIVTAAITAALGRSGSRVAVIKPAQTGVGPGSTEIADADTVARLAAPATARTLATYPDPLAPTVAARVAGQPPLGQEQVESTVRELAVDHDVILVEGAGGLLVPIGVSPADGLEWTIADLARSLDDTPGFDVEVVVVTRAGLGTLNHTALTLEALARRDLTASVVIGAWPDSPGLAERTNLTNLDVMPGEIVGVVPAGVGEWEPEVFRAQCRTWLTSALGGTRSGSPWLPHEAGPLRLGSGDE